MELSLPARIPLKTCIKERSHPYLNVGGWNRLLDDMLYIQKYDITVFRDAYSLVGEGCVV
jgi:hypothetical protein